jgi:hypothetical protein
MAQALRKVAEPESKIILAGAQEIEKFVATDRIAGLKAWKPASN